MGVLKNISLAKKILILILMFTALSRLIHLDYPKGYVFDEVYHAFTAKQYLLGSKAAWEWWTVPPPGVAYEWTHPPLAKEIMAMSMYILHSTSSFAYRLPGALLGILSVYLIYAIAMELFKSEWTALLSAFIFSVDGLNFVQSRTGMNDIYIVTFALVALLFFLKKKFYLSSFFLGLALASKWSAIYLFPVLILLALKDKHYRAVVMFACVPVVVYLIAYLPFFTLGHSWNQFVQLQYQMWYYHTHLKAHHDYASPWWSWPFNLYPVWYFVEYHPNGTISNIFASGNPVVFIGGFIAVLVSLYQFIRNKARQLLIPLAGYLIFWLPWAFSPRIMFLYHYSPSVPFMSILLGYQLTPLVKNDRVMLWVSVGLILLGFIVFYPWLTGIPLPKNILEVFFRFSLTKNPFG